MRGSYKRMYLTVVAAFSILVAGCANDGPSPTAASPTTQESDYRLNPGDTVRLVVYGDETLTGDYMLDKRGVITIPLIDEVPAAGLTKAELQEAIVARFNSENFIENPHITIDLTALQPFYILGEVNTPGSYAYQPSLDVFKAVALAGGYTPRAAKNKVIISRNGAKGRQSFYATEGTPILPGDSIKVRQRIF